MSSFDNSLTYAIKNGVLVHVDDVESGLACNCFCPACGKSLVAKKGDINSHHFAHHNADECAYGQETALHLAAKDILSDAGEIWLPARYPHNGVFDGEGAHKEGVYNISSVAIEKKEGFVVPDVIVVAGGEKIYIEITVTHGIDAVKYRKLRDANISTLEIDLREQDNISAEKLREIVIGSCLPEIKSWAHEAVPQKLWDTFFPFAKEYPIVYREEDEGFGIIHTDFAMGCPLRSTIISGAAYAETGEDCYFCPYLLHKGTYTSLMILCMGEERVKTLDDISIPRAERLIKNQTWREKAIKTMVCPKCGKPMVKRSDMRGMFLGCSEHPDCRFKAYYLPDEEQLLGNEK